MGIPIESLKITFGELVKYLSEQVEREVKLQILAQTALTPRGEKIKKFEEIKQMARELFVRMILLEDNHFLKSKTQKMDRLGKYSANIFEIAWRRAEEFHNLAKQKEKEMKDEN